MSSARSFTIGELARRTGASIKALRIYDRYGLLVTAGRSASNYRLFTVEAVLCVRAIKTLQAAGLSLREMRDMARTYGCGDFRSYFSRALKEALERTDARIATLETSRRALSELVRLTGATRNEGDIARLLTLPHRAGSMIVGDDREHDLAAAATRGIA